MRKNQKVTKKTPKNHNAVTSTRHLDLNVLLRDWAMKRPNKGNNNSKA
jgi:hypothetical protein